MGILTLLFALGETISESIHEKAEQRRAIEEKRRYENIDFYNIEHVTFDGTETAYRIETEEEFDPVMTDFLTRQDGWQHYETETVEYEVPNGLNYCFTIKYKNGETIYRAFHESSHLTKRLLEYCDDEEDSDDFFDEISNYDCNTTSPSKLKAIKEARDYLVYNSGFSYLGLIKQLEYNKISHEDKKLENSIEIKIKNDANQVIDSVQVSAVYFNAKEVVGYTTQFISEFPATSSIIETVYVPTDESGELIKFDKYEIIINAYNHEK